MTGNKIGFCKAWGIEHLIDDEAVNIALGPRFGVNVYYPAAVRPPVPQVNPVPTPGSMCSRSTARAFQTFDEIKPWIQE